MSDAQTNPASDDAQFVFTLPDDPRAGKDWPLWAGVLALLVLVTFSPAINGGFLWDDDHHVEHNPALVDWHGLLRAWVPHRDKDTGAWLLSTPQYYPLTHTSFFIEKKIWGNATIGYHIVNLLLHAGSAFIIWRILRRLRVPGAWLAAAIWAVHPLQVESVAWITERKNTLSGLLFFGSLWFYLDFAQFPRNDGKPATSDKFSPLAALGISFALFIAAMFSKTTACVLPPTLLIILWWQHRLDRKNILAAIPYFVFGAALALVTIMLETTTNGNVQAVGPEYDQTPLQRLLIASRGVWFYAIKTVFPNNLTFNYPRVLPPLHGDALHYAALAGVLAVLVALIVLARRARAPLAAVLYFLVALFPGLGFFSIFPFKYSFVADHFQYLAGIGLIALIVGGVAHLMGIKPTELQPDAPEKAADQTPSQAVTPAAVIGALVLLVPAVISYIHSQAFADPMLLWRDTIAKSPDSWLAKHNLAVLLMKEADKATTEAAKLSRLKDTKDAEDNVKLAGDDLNEAENLLLDCIDLRGRDADLVGTRAHIYLERSNLPQADALAQLRIGQELAQQAVLLQTPLNDTKPDPFAYFELGTNLWNQTQVWQERISRPQTQPTTQTSTQPSTQAATLPTTMPSTRPASVEETTVMDLSHRAIAAFDETIRICQLAGQKFPSRRAADYQTLGKAAATKGDVYLNLAADAYQRFDVLASRTLTKEAAKAFAQALEVDNQNKELHFKFGLCLAQFAGPGKNDATRIAAKVELMRSLSTPPAPSDYQAYFQLGMLCAEYYQNLDDLIAAIGFFEEVQRTHPDYNDVGRKLANLRKALPGLEAQAATQLSGATQPATQPAAVQP